MTSSQIMQQRSPNKMGEIYELGGGAEQVYHPIVEICTNDEEERE